MATGHARTRLGSRGRPEESRTAILQAAIREFAREGIAGARTDAIAKAAKVNKALLYYYFHDKDALYGAALDHVFQERNRRLMPVLAADIPPGEKILRYVGAFFDYLAENPAHREMVQRELFNVPRRGQMQRIVKLYMRPMFEEMIKVLREGIATGIFRPIDPMQFIPSMAAVVVHYFGSANFLKLMTNEDPLSPERLAARRAAVLDFISAALFEHSALPVEGEPK
ncbi:MAG TPA: TetR/AcrR family transcriptional regulator [Terriglobales bacterium]|nr:TetR/AcrR family transcriptional regulator [Terriglobales bacterium]